MTMKIIDVKKEYQPNEWTIARLVWQELFNQYVVGGGDLSRMDDLLIDFQQIAHEWKRGLDDFLHRPNMEPGRRLWWSFEKSITQLHPWRNSYEREVQITMDFCNQLVAVETIEAIKGVW